METQLHMQPQFLTAAELAAASGKNEKSIRRAITSGRLPADKDARGQYRIAVDAGFALYPPKEPINGQVDAGPEAEDVEPASSASTSATSTRELPGILEAARRIIALECSPELWAALRAVLQP